MFGVDSFYYKEKIVFALRKKEESIEDNGIWIASKIEHHEVLKGLIKDLRHIKMYGIKSWLLLPEDSDYFEQGVLKIAELIKEQNIQVDWFFPNTATHGDYKAFNIISAENETLEQCFISYVESENVPYSNIVTHFVELCTSFFADIKKFQKASVIAVDHNPRPLGGYPLKKQIKKRLKGYIFKIYRFVCWGV